MLVSPGGKEDKD